MVADGSRLILPDPAVSPQGVGRRFVPRRPAGYAAGVKRIAGYPGCMACGKANPRGLQLDLFFADGRVETRLRLPACAQGFPGAAHGGVLCTILDEVMAWSAIETTGRFHVTGEMNVRFLSPALTGEEIFARGEIPEDKRRYLVCRGEVQDAAGKLLAKAEGKFFPVSAERQAAMEERWRQAMARRQPET